ncbi:LacI family DNA-binding transcriptional regulator [Rhodovastum atsumiense]|uniref:LacI family DNA-binding transcriptional regulator n=1 Tax=Rhodovastum atsumiense TaxID=504468 RepID=UPI00193B2B49|nr:LacI family DNA-binding transcriptional regulator [Rhodovastum atsumiense]
MAAYAGVSKATVSRFLSGRSDVLSETTWKQIQDAIAALDYRPSQIARSLKGGRTRLIGIVVADVTNPYSVAVLRGAEDECQRAGYMLALCNSGGSHAKEQELLAGLRAYRIEGLILNSAGIAADQVSDALPDGLPIVLLDRKLPPGRFDFVGLNNIAAATEATRHLVGHGFGDIALIAEPITGVSVRTERALGFRQAIAENEGCTGTVIEVDLHQPDAMQQAVARFLATPSSRRKAVIAASGLVTLRTVQAIQSLGLHMPDDVGLVGFDELEWSALVPPGITTIAQPTYDIGVAAVRNLLARLAGHRDEPHSTIFTGTLIERGSSASEAGLRPMAVPAPAQPAAGLV